MDSLRRPEGGLPGWTLLLALAEVGCRPVFDYLPLALGALLAMGQDVVAADVLSDVMAVVAPQARQRDGVRVTLSLG